MCVAHLCIDIYHYTETNETYNVSHYKELTMSNLSDFIELIATRDIYLNNNISIGPTDHFDRPVSGELFAGVYSGRVFLNIPLVITRGDEINASIVVFQRYCVNTDIITIGKDDSGQCITRENLLLMNGVFNLGLLGGILDGQSVGLISEGPTHTDPCVFTVSLQTHPVKLISKDSIYFHDRIAQLTGTVRPHITKLNPPIDEPFNPTNQRPWWQSAKTIGIIGGIGATAVIGGVYFLLRNKN